MDADIGLMYLLNFALVGLWVCCFTLLFLLAAVRLGIYETLFLKFNPIPQSKFYQFLNNIRHEKGNRLLIELGILIIFLVWAFLVPWSNDYDNRVYICLNNATEYHDVGACSRKLECHPKVKEVYLWQAIAVRRTLCENCYQMSHAPLPPYIE